MAHGFGRGTTRAEDAHGTPTQSHISPSILVYENYQLLAVRRECDGENAFCVALEAVDNRPVRLEHLEFRGSGFGVLGLGFESLGFGFWVDQHHPVLAPRPAQRERNLRTTTSQRCEAVPRMVRI